MTCTQKQAIWELCLQGLHDAAIRAEQSWNHGEQFEPDARLPLTRQVADLIDRANWDAGEYAAWQHGEAATAERPAQQTLLAAA